MNFALSQMYNCETRKIRWWLWCKDSKSSNRRIQQQVKARYISSSNRGEKTMTAKIAKRTKSKLWITRATNTRIIRKSDKIKFNLRSWSRTILMTSLTIKNLTKITNEPYKLIKTQLIKIPPLPLPIDKIR